MLKNAFALLACLIVGWLTLGAPVAHAADAVVTSCGSEADLRAKLTAMQGDGGGTLTFACGASPAPIVLTGGVLPAIVTPTTVDGGGIVTISGGNASRVFYVGAAGSLTLRGLTIVKGLVNSAGLDGDGGAIYSDGSLTIADSSLRENRSITGSGGAVVAYGPTTITDTEFAFNTAANGGALYPRWQSVVTIAGSNFHDNRANDFLGRGGALLAWDGPQVTVQASTFYSNSADYVGGAIYVLANTALTLTTSTLEANAAPNGGAAVWNDGRARVERALLRGNLSEDMGTGGAIFNGGTLALVNSTVTENAGPGLYNWGAADVLFSTVMNQVGRGYQSGYGILAASNSVVNLKDTIVAGNVADCNAPAGIIQSQGYNIASDNSCSLGAPTDRQDADPLLSDLGAWGGPTLSRYPLEGSPALDNGQCVTGVTTDQRGLSRPDGAACDIGAAEAQHYTVTVERTGEGTVTSDLPGIQCGAACAHAWFEETSVVLTATPAEGYTFLGWGGVCAAEGASSACHLLLDASATAHAVFTPEVQQVWLPAVQK